MAMTYSKANDLLRYIIGTAGGEVYIGLSTTTPGRDGTGVTEPPSAAGYARKRLLGMGTPSLGTVTNTETIYFPEATGDWGTCTYFCLFSSATASATTSLTAYGALQTAVHPTDGKVPLIRAGNLTLSM